MNRLEIIEKRMNEIAALVETETDIEKLKALDAEYKDLKEERSMLLGITPVEITKRSLPTPPASTTVETHNSNEPEQRSVDLGSVEYRTAFMNYVKTGKMSDTLRNAIPVNSETRATSTTVDAGALIPNTVMDGVIEALVAYGEIMPRVTKINIKGGVDYPYANTKPTASWIAEGSVAAKQKKTIDGVISFKYHKLQIRVAVTLEASVTSLDTFERLIAQNIAEAMAVAFETSIINGTGSGQPLGVVSDTRITSGQKINFSTADATWKGWKEKLFGKLPLAYRNRNRNVVLMNPATWDSYVDGMTDDVGQPIARTTVGINGTETLRFNGREVILTNQLPGLDDASVGDIFVIYMDLADYIINTNMQLVYRRYFDEETDEFIDKMTLIADGKVGDVNSIIMLKKAAAPAS